MNLLKKSPDNGNGGNFKFGASAIVAALAIVFFSSCETAGNNQPGNNQPGNDRNESHVENVDTVVNHPNDSDSTNFTNSLKADNEFNKLFNDLFKKGDEEYEDRGIVYRTIKFENGAKITLSTGRNYECIKVIFGGENENYSISFERIGGPGGHCIIRGSNGQNPHKKTLYSNEAIESASIELRGIIDEMHKNGGKIKIEIK